MDWERYLTAGMVCITLGLAGLFGGGYFLEEYKGLPLIAACVPILVGFRLIARAVATRGD